MQWSRTIKYIILSIATISFILFLSNKVSNNIKHVKENFNMIEIEILNELSSNISRLVKKNIPQGTLYKTLQTDKHLRRYLEYSLATIVSEQYKYAYIVQKTDNKSYRYLLDGSLEENPIIGDMFFASNLAWETVYKIKEPTVYKNHANEDIGMTYLYPILIENKIEAILAIDFSKKRIKETMSHLYPMEEMLNYSIISLFIFIILLMIFITLWYKKNIESNKRKEELEKNEITLKQNIKEIRLANRSKSEFLANMSHEIRTPMNAIMGLSDLILRTSLNDKQQDYVEKIKISSSSLLRIINDILDVSKMESGKLELETRVFSIVDLISKLKIIFNTTTKKDTVNFEVFLGEELPLYFLGDVFRIEQILINLLSNAFKFTTHGHVHLFIDYDKNKKQNIQIRVEDSGVGIEKDKIDILFNDFTQADSSITRKYGGTGLGLSISKQLIALHAGNIEVQSEVNVGTKFIVNLNLEVHMGNQLKEKVNDIQTIRNKLYSYREVNILIVEDNLINQNVITGYLEEFDFNLTLANNGEECINILKNNSFDLILMDINMPIMDGYQATSLIRKNKISTPVIALSANAREEDYLLSINYGMDGHIGKPIEPGTLYMNLEKFLPNSKISQALEKIQNDIEKHEVYPFTLISNSIALKRLNYNHDLYKKILNQFYEEYTSSSDELALMNVKEKKDFLHKLKSAAGVIGANILFELAQRYYIVIELKDDDQVLYDTLLVEMEAVMEELKNYLNYLKVEKSNNDTNSVPIDTQSIHNAFKELEKALETKKSKVIKESYKNFDAIVSDKKYYDIKRKILDAIEVYDFKKALQHLKESNI